MKALKYVVAAGVVVALAFPLVNLVAGGPKGTVLSRSAKDPKAVHVAEVLEAKCGHCHVEGTPRPFYASFPVASSMVEQDIRGALRDFDMGLELGATPVAEPALARLEYGIQEGGMPPGKYVALHWNAGVGAADRDAILAFVREGRAALSQPGVPEALRGQGLRPLPASLPTDPRKVELGKALYDDRRLSGDGSVACASCHDLAKGGTDQAPVSTGIRGQKGGINAPTTFNAALGFVQFWDGRAATLADQAAGPPANPVEMGATWDGIVETLAKDEAFVAKMKEAYPDGVTQKNVTDAIAEFEKTLLTPNSKFDKFLAGDAAALTAEEKAGHALFVSKGCATCHVGELLGGRSFEKMGRRADYFAERGKPTDADLGRFAVSKAERDRGRFKVPTLRNVARTFPYFHDASRATLQDAVVAMAKYQNGLALTGPEAASLVKFLEALTGEYQGKPL